MYQGISECDEFGGLDIAILLQAPHTINMFVTNAVIDTFT